uniref:Carboxypeptidase n=1 Tax=Chenopodium quinoa TaxID=63459 RepID=A0A803N6G8_CHEQI
MQGASGTGIGNFEEVGPLDTNLKTRNSTWLKKADLLFVDNPVGTGFSYVEDKKLVVKSDEEAGEDLTRLLKEIFNKNVKLQKSPLFIVAESYGGKFAVALGLAAHKAILSGQLNLKLGGIALGDSWISPEDFASSWGPLLKDVSRLDDEGFQNANSLAEQIKQQLSKGQFENATETWSYPAGNEGGLGSLMDGPVRKKLKIIPDNVTWGGQGGLVFDALESDFMKPRIAEVDELLSKGVDVTIYNGQLDVICATKGTQAWVEKLKWEGLKSFLSESRTPLYCDSEAGTKGFYRSYKNLHFYWILGAGHFVPLEQPCIALKMVGNITQSPAT